MPLELSCTSPPRKRTSLSPLLALLAALFLLTGLSCKSPSDEESGESESSNQDHESAGESENEASDGTKSGKGADPAKETDPSDEGGSGSPAPSGPVKADAECTDETGAQLSRYLESMCQIPSIGNTELDGLAEADVETAQPSPFATTIRLEPGTQTVDGEPATGSLLEDRLNRNLEFAKHSGESATVVLAISADTPSSEVSEIIASLQNKGIVDVQFAFLTGKSLPVQPADPERYAELVAELDGKETSELQYSLATMLTEAVAECAEQGKVFRSLSTAAPDQRCQLAARGLGDGYVACGCKGDVVAVQNLMYRLSMPEQLITLVPVTLDANGTSIAADGTWEELAPAVLEQRGKSITFSGE